jgi:hypothetical protein
VSAALADPLPVVAKRNYISGRTMMFMIVAVVCSLRAAPTMAVYGLGSIILYVVPAIVFLIPQALVSAELASAWPGGVYRWVTEAFGPKLGLLAIWCQYAMTIFYYPAMLAYVASTFAYVINPNLASSGLFTAIVIVTVYWLAVVVSGRGMKAVSGLSSAGAIIGTILPGIVLVGMGAAYLIGGNASAAPLHVHDLLPAWAGIASLVLIVNNFLSYSGMEMNAVHVSELKDPKREFPKAMIASIGIIMLVFILPALAVSFIVPASDVSLTAGVMQAFTSFFGYFGVSFFVSPVAILIILAMLGGMLAWLAGPSTGLLLIGREQGFIPPYFQKLNKRGMQMNIMIWQGVHPGGVKRLLDLRGDDDTDLSDRLCADVHGGRQAEARSARSPARLHHTGAHMAVRDGLRLDDRRVRDRLRAALAIPQRRHARLHPARRGRRRDHGPGRPDAARQIQKAALENHGVEHRHRRSGGHDHHDQHRGGLAGARRSDLEHPRRRTSDSRAPRLPPRQPAPDDDHRGARPLSSRRQPDRVRPAEQQLRREGKGRKA